jgi:hypothetical protein
MAERYDDDEEDGDEPEDRKPNESVTVNSAGHRVYAPTGEEELSDGSIIFWW